MNVRTLFTPDDGLDAMLENGPWFIWNNPLIQKKGHPDENLLKEDGRSSYARVIVELRADTELKDNIDVAMIKITREGHYTCNVHVEYEWKVQRIHVLNRVEPTVEVSNLNPFDALNLVDNDGEFGINGGLLICNTPISEKIDKIKRQIGEGKLMLLDNDWNTLVPTGIVESDSEVEMVFDETVNLRISTSGKDGSDKGYGTNRLLE
nr:hypothetical protein [Tanacetum cinerariifolium]